MGLLSGITNLFSTPAGAPDMSQTDYTAAANQGAAYNQSQIGNYESYAPGFTSFISNLYNQTVNPQATAAQNTQYQLGSQLATQGYTSAMGNFDQYARTMGLQNAAATGAPVGGSFAQSYGTSLGEQQILGNQLQGNSILGSYAQNQQNLAQSFMAPSQGILSSSLVNPTAFMTGAQANNQIANQNAEINFANSQQQSWFGNLLTGAVQSGISTPFSAFENMNSMASNPQGDVSSLCGGSNKGTNAGQSASPYASGYDSQGIPMAAQYY